MITKHNAASLSLHSTQEKTDVDLNSQYRKYSCLGYILEGSIRQLSDAFDAKQSLH